MVAETWLVRGNPRLPALDVRPAARWILFSHPGQGHDGAEAWRGVGFIIALFGCVLLHEFGHALTEKRCGIRTRDITVLPIGGIARLERLAENPRHELWVTLTVPEGEHR